MLGHAPFGRFAFGQIGAPPGVASDAAAYVVTCWPARLAVSMQGASGAFVVGGNDATLVYSPGVVLTALGGAFSMFGSAAGLAVGFPASAGAFVVAGNDASARLNFPASTGLFSTGGMSNLARQFVLAASPSLSAPTANFLLFSPLGGCALGEGDQETPPATTFAFTGQNAEIAAVKLITASASSFVFTGRAAALTYAGYPPQARVFPSVGRGARGVSRGTEPIRVFASTGHGVRRRAFGG